MRRVILESPYAGNFITRFLNRRYARKCLRDALARNDAPIASHLLYTQRGVLDDSVIKEREVGIHAGLIWGAVADATVVYIDRGVSHGMNRGIERAMLERRPVEFRSLDPELEKRLVIHREIKGTC